MKVVLASQSKVKIDAVKQSLASCWPEAEVNAVKVQSGVAEQPVGEETLIGARNRIRHAISSSPGGDLYISIENGIYLQSNGNYVDRAVVLCITGENKEFIEYSKDVELPLGFVTRAKEIGFDRTTVGRVMEDEGFVKHHYDPHLSIAGLSREEFIKDALINLFKQILNLNSNSKQDIKFPKNF